MDDPRGNTPRTSTTQKSVSRDPATKSDERVEKKKRRNERDDGSGSSDEGHDSTSRSVTRFKAYKGKGSRKETEKKQHLKAVLHRFESQYYCCMEFMQGIIKECNYFECLGLSTNSILQNIKEKVRILQKYIKNQDISIEQDLELFQKNLYDIFVTSNPYKYKTIGVSKIDKFRSVCPVGTREAKIEESGEDVCNIISKIIVLQDAVVTYSQLCVEMFGKTIYLVDWDDNEIIEQFITKELPADIAVGSQNSLLISFTNINRVICYNLNGQQLFEQWKLPFPVHPHIAIFQGTVYVPDVQHNRVLLYEYYDQSSCRLHIKTPYIRNLNIRLKEKENDKKTLIAEICHLVNGQLVVSDINSDCLLYISKEGEIVSRLSLPSTATDICRWDCNQIGVTLPLEKQLRVIGNLSKTVRTISLSHAYVKVCKLGKGHIVCYSDKPSQLDILAIKNYNQVEMIRRINIPFVVKSLEIENETLNLLIVTRNKVFQYNTSIDSVGHSCRNSIKMIPRDFLSGVKHSLNFSGGCIDKMFVYLIGNNRMLAINDHNLVGRDHIMNNQLILYIDLLDVFSRNICVGEMWSSTLYVQDMTVSDKARHVIVPPGFGDEKLVRIDCLVITENNLIAVYDSENGNIKILTFDGQLLDFIKLGVSSEFKSDINMCRWQSNTLIITTKFQLLTLKVEFPLSLTIYQTENVYEFIASLSNNQLACRRRGEAGTLYVIEIDEEFLTVNTIKILDAGMILLEGHIDSVHDIITDANDVIIVNNNRYFVFFNTDGEHLHSVRHYMDYSSISNTMTTDNCYLYVHGQWERYFGDNKYNNILCFTQTGEYSRRFLNDRIYKDEVNFSSINCKGPRFVGSCSNINKLYVEGLFQVKREIFLVSRLLTDKCPVQVKDIDISDEGKTIVCEKANNGIVKIFDRDGQMLCHKDVRSLVGGVCFTGDSDIMVTIPKRQEIFQLKQQDLEKYKVWQSHVPYGVIWRTVANIYWCVHINLIEYHCIKIDGDQLKVLESLSLLNLDSGLHFPSISSQMNKKIFSHELINNLEQSRGDGEGRKGKSKEIISKGRLKVRCGNYIAESMSGIEEVSVKKLPYRTAVVPLSIPTVEEPVNYRYHRDSNHSKLIKLYDNFSVFMFRDTVTLICTTTGDILQQKQLPQQQPRDICRWTDERFIVTFGNELMVFNRDLCCLKTINTEKYYSRICKYNENQLVCGGNYFSMESFHVYVDVLDIDIDNGTCERKNEMYSEVVKMREWEEVGVWIRMLMRKEVGLGVLDIAVTSSGDVVVVKWKNDSQDVVVLWYREKSLVNSICLPKCTNYHNFKHRPCLTTLGDYVYVTDRLNNIYQIPGDIPHQTSEDIHKYLLLRDDDNEVFQVLGFHISDNSFMVFGIIAGRQSFAFFHYER
ncbi:Hypothetical predicted protein [Octopus vulgaris]|uniref:Uncharacterized protein n=1 Tax=Octopus vulgaris TaxID=6645 RepID=A0AA36BXT7_OCTVU|nr:Hypothetical predicted protein [Octopus vulgaris]